MVISPALCYYIALPIIRCCSSLMSKDRTIHDLNHENCGRIRLVNPHISWWQPQVITQDYRGLVQSKMMFLSVNAIIDVLIFQNKAQILDSKIQSINTNRIPATFFTHESNGSIQYHNVVMPKSNVRKHTKWQSGKSLYINMINFLSMLMEMPATSLSLIKPILESKYAKNQRPKFLCLLICISKKSFSATVKYSPIVESTKSPQSFRQASKQ